MTLTISTKTEVQAGVKDKLDELFQYVAVGDGASIPSEGDTMLENETFRTERFDVEKTSFAEEITVTGEIGFGENNAETIKEIGWFTESSNGTLRTRELLNNEILKTSDIEVILPKRMLVEVKEV
jgi:hypothetical protein